MNAILHPRSHVKTNRARDRTTKAKRVGSGDALEQPTELLTMATHALPSSHIIDDEHTRVTSRAPARVSLLRRLYIAILVSQMRRAQREIDRKLGPGALQRALRTGIPPQR